MLYVLVCYMWAIINYSKTIKGNLKGPYGRSQSNQSCQDQTKTKIEPVNMPSYLSQRI